MRIAIIGTSGSGKTTLGRRLAAKLDTPFVEMDAINWQAGWRGLQSEDADEFMRRVEAATQGVRWVCDGNYGPVGRMVCSRATHLVWLDYDRPVVMARVICRSVGRAASGRKLWAGNREDWRRWFDSSHPIRWAWDTWKRRRSTYAAMVADPAFAHLTVIRLRRPHEAKAAVKRLCADAGAA